MKELKIAVSVLYDVVKQRKDIKFIKRRKVNHTTELLMLVAHNQPLCCA